MSDHKFVPQCKALTECLSNATLAVLLIVLRPMSSVKGPNRQHVEGLIEAARLANYQGTRSSLTRGADGVLRHPHTTDTGRASTASSLPVVSPVGDRALASAAVPPTGTQAAPAFVLGRYCY